MCNHQEAHRPSLLRPPANAANELSPATGSRALPIGSVTGRKISPVGRNRVELLLAVFV